MVTIFLGTQALTVFRDAGQGRFGYTLCFGTAGISAAFAAYVLLQTHEPRINFIPKTSILEIFRSIKGNVLLEQYVGFFTLWQFAMGIGSAFFNLHMMRILKMDPGQMGYMVLTAAVASLLGSRIWGRVMDRIGDRCVILATGTLIAFHVWFWVFAWQGFLWPLWIANVVGGFLWGGFNIAAFVLPQRLIGKEYQQQAYGFLGLLAGLGFALGSLFGGVLTTLIPQILFQIGPFVFSHYQVVFILSSVGRLIAVLWISKMSLAVNRHPRTIPESIRDSFRAIRQTFSKQYVSLQ
jgi:MFS family permease